MRPLSELQVLRFLIEITVLFVTARILADVMKRLSWLLAGVERLPQEAERLELSSCWRECLSKEEPSSWSWRAAARMRN